MFAANWCGPSQLGIVVEALRARYNSSDVLLKDGAIYIGLNATVELPVYDRDTNESGMCVVGGVVWYGVVWCGVVWCVVLWCGVVWCVKFVHALWEYMLCHGLCCVLCL